MAFVLSSLDRGGWGGTTTWSKRGPPGCPSLEETRPDALGAQSENSSHDQKGQQVRPVAEPNPGLWVQDRMG